MSSISGPLIDEGPFLDLLSADWDADNSLTCDMSDSLAYQGSQDNISEDISWDFLGSTSVAGLHILPSDAAILSEKLKVDSTEVYSPRTDSDSHSVTLDSERSEDEGNDPVPLSNRRKRRRPEEADELEARIRKLEQENELLNSQVKLFSHTKCTPRGVEDESLKIVKNARIEAVKWFAQSLTTGGPEEFDEYIDEMVHDDVVSITSSFGEMRGKEAQKRVVQAWFTACPDFTLIANEATALHVSAQDVQVRLDWTACGTHAGWIGGIKPTRRTLEFSGSTFFTFVGTKVSEAIWVWKDGVFNNPTLKQLLFGFSQLHQQQTKQAKNQVNNVEGCCVM